MTAYELRISDWSSDVCSSDLHQQTQRADVRMGQDHRRHRQSHRRLHLPDDHLQLRLIAQDHPGNRMMTKRSATMTRGPTETAPKTGGSEIGRASCRERVCKYV